MDRQTRQPAQHKRRSPLLRVNSQEPRRSKREEEVHYLAEIECHLNQAEGCGGGRRVIRKAIEGD